MIQAGKLRQPVAIYRNVETRTASGAVELAPLLLGSRDAMIQPIAGGETVRGEQVQADLTHEITMRYWSEVTPDMNLVYADPNKGVNRTFEIMRVINTDERNVEMIMHCKELV